MSGQHVVVEHHLPWAGECAWPPIVCGASQLICPATKHGPDLSFEVAKDAHPAGRMEGMDSRVHVYVSRGGSAHDFEHVHGDAAWRRAMCGGARVVVRRERVATVYPGRVQEVARCARVMPTTHDASVPTFLHAGVGALVTGQFASQTLDLTVHGGVAMARGAFRGMRGRVTVRGLQTVLADVFESNCLESLTCDAHTEAIQRGAFEGSHFLREVRFGARLHRVGASAFRCARLTVVDLSHTSVVVIEHRAFQQCTALRRVVLPMTVEHVSIGSGRIHGHGTDATIVTWGNGVWMSLRAQRRLAEEHGVQTRVLDLRWLAPLPVADLLAAADSSGRVLVADETRRSGGVGEGVVTALVEHGFRGSIGRVSAKDSFVPLGGAAELVLLSEEDVVAGVLRLG